MTQTHRSSHAPLHGGGFTIVELLVVIGVISVLIGLLLPALSGVQRRSAKTNELSHIKQVYVAWSLYGSNNNDAALPGFLEKDVQEKPVPGVSRGWNVQYEYPTPPVGLTDKAIPPAPQYGAADLNIAGPWTWRLGQYLEFSHEVLRGHIDDEEESMFGLVANAEKVAYEPAFGYNGIYVGGWWQMHNFGGTPLTPVVRYFDHCGPPTPTSGARRPLSIPTSISQINRSSEMVVFCSSSRFNASQSPIGLQHHFKADRPGSHLVTPPTVASEVNWNSDPGDPTAIVTIADEVHAPIGRHTGYAAVLWADGHCDAQSAAGLYDQRLWINKSDDIDYQHSTCP